MRMGSLVGSAAALLWTFLITLLSGPPSILGQDLKETDALCTADGCFVLYFQRKTFLDSWRACKEDGGNLAIIKRKDDAKAIAQLFSTVDLRHSRTKVRVWIGLQRQPRHCSTTRALRGFSWTTGDQDTEYTNWQNEDSFGMCSTPRCVVMGYNTQEQSDNLKWLDDSCVVHMDGYLCRYAYKGMCSALWNEGAGNPLYLTPFNLLSTLLTHVPLGSVATVPCLSVVKQEPSVLCTVKEDGSVGWSVDSPLCSEPPVSHNWCTADNGGCEHFCRVAGIHFYCECADGYQLAENGQNCELPDVCEGAPCKFECLPLSDSYRCACPDGYMLSPDEHGCMDVDECLQSPCEHVCVNSPGSFECRCRDGYLLDEEGACEDTDECMANPCEHACENTAGSHICHCNLGFSPIPEDTSRCQDTDECQIPGTCQQMCVNFEGGFQCYCEEGYELMSDHYSCHKMEEDYDQSAVTPSFAWATHRPGLLWDPDHYDWDTEQRNTDWPGLDDDHSLKWLTDPPKTADSGVIWVTSSHKEDLPFTEVHDTSIQKRVKDKDELGEKEISWSELGQSSQVEFGMLIPSLYTTAPPTTEPLLITTPDWYEENETTTTVPWFSTSTLSEGGNPEDSALATHMPTGSSFHKKANNDLLRANSELPQDILDEEEALNKTHSNETADPSQDFPTQSSASETGGSGEAVDIVQEESGQRQSNTWLLVAILVPVCIFTVLMVALGIIYCNCFADHPRNKKAADCYHWISGAHDKQGAPTSSSGVMTHV